MECCACAVIDVLLEPICVVFFVVFYRVVRKEAVSSVAARHEAYLQLKEIEYGAWSLNSTPIIRLVIVVVLLDSVS